MFQSLLVYWRENRAGHKQSQTYLEYVDDNFLLQVTEDPERRCYAGPCSQQQVGASGECDIQWQPGLQWPWNHGIWDSCSNEKGPTAISLPWTSKSQILAFGTYLNSCPRKLADISRNPASKLRSLEHTNKEEVRKNARRPSWKIWWQC